MLSTPLLAAGLAAVASITRATELHERNLVYRSPFVEVPELNHDVQQIAKRAADVPAAPYKGALDFKFGVASGDANENSAILWTHPVPAQANVREICVKYETSTSKSSFSKKNIVDQGEVKTTPDIDYSVKVETKKLKPKTQYYYRFSSCTNSSNVSPVGAFKTTPTPGDSSVDKVSFAVYSCSNYPEGYFVAYEQAAARNKVDYWIHLGDYQYEYYVEAPSAGPARALQPQREISTLDDYRQRYKTYHQDTGLLRLRREKGLYAIWDDHEVADNSWKAGTADSNDTVQGEVNGVKFSQRKINAVKAYNEWIPLRPHPSDKDLRIWRKFSFGKLLELDLWDTRQYDRDITDVYYNTAEIAKIKDQENRTLQGFNQEAWAFANIKNRKATWSIIGQQIVMNQIIELQSDGTPGVPDLDLDAWDGYTAARRRFVNTIKQNNIDNVIVLAGDSHANWVYDGVLPEDLPKYNPATGKGSLFVEFGVTAVSSTSSYGKNQTAAQYAKRASDLVAANKNLAFAEGAKRGYYELTVTKDKVSAEYLGVDNVFDPASKVSTLATFEVKDGANKLTRPLNGGKPALSGAILGQQQPASSRRALRFEA